MRGKMRNGQRGEEVEKENEDEERGCDVKPVGISSRLPRERYDVTSVQSMNNDKIRDGQELIRDLSPRERNVVMEEGNVGSVGKEFGEKMLKNKEKVTENKEVACHEKVTKKREVTTGVHQKIVEVVGGMEDEGVGVGKRTGTKAISRSNEVITEAKKEDNQLMKAREERRERTKLRGGGIFEEDPDEKAWEEELEENVETLGIADMAEWTYRGEGNDNIVVGHTTKGEILRLRKTSPDQQASRRDLLKHALKDVKFFREAALPHFGPLLTDGWRVVILTQETLNKLRQVLVGKRPAFRLCKEVNQHGVATLSADAATAFVSRNQTFRPQLHSPPLLTFPYTQLLEPGFHLPTSTPQTHPPPSKTQPPLPTSMTPPLLSSMTNSPSILRPIQSPTVPNAAASSDRSNLLTEPCRASQPPVVDMAAHVVCVEVKPKQGFPDISTPNLPLCRFCLKQFEKVHEGARSEYCPCDLFSGDWVRMTKAVDALFSRPQNNLRVFKDGKQQEDVQSFQYLRDVILLALTHDLESNSCGMFATSKLSSSSFSNLPSGSALGRCLLLQQMDTLGAVGASQLYSQVCEDMGTSKEELDQTLTDFSSWSGRLGGFTKDFDLDECKDFSTMSKKSQMVEVTCRKEELPAKRKTTQCLEPPPKRKRSQASWEQIKLLQNYLAATTAKDCSFMVLLLGPLDKYPSPILHKPSEVNLVGYVDKDSSRYASPSTHSFSAPAAIPRVISSPPSNLTSLSSATVAYSKAPTSTASFSPIHLSTTLPSSHSTVMSSSAAMQSSSSVSARPSPPSSFMSSTSSGSVSPFSIENKGHFYLCQVTAVDLVAKSPSKIPKHEKDYLRRKQKLLHLRACGQQPRCCT